MWPPTKNSRNCKRTFSIYPGEGDIFCFGKAEAYDRQSIAVPAWTRSKEHRLSTMIIAAFLTILVCSFLFVLNLAHHNSAATVRASSNGSSAASTQLSVYVGSANGALVKLNAANGKAIWRYATHGSHLPAPATVANGTVYVGTQDGSVYALHAATDAVLWHFQTQAAVLSSPTVAGGFVYVGSSDSYLYKLQASDGKLLWHKNMRTGYRCRHCEYRPPSAITWSTSVQPIIPRIVTSSR